MHALKHRRKSHRCEYIPVLLSVLCDLVLEVVPAELLSASTGVVGCPTGVLIGAEATASPVPTRCAVGSVLALTDAASGVSALRLGDSFRHSRPQPRPRPYPRGPPGRVRPERRVTRPRSGASGAFPGILFELLEVNPESLDAGTVELIAGNMVFR